MRARRPQVWHVLPAQRRAEHLVHQDLQIRHWRRTLSTCDQRDRVWRCRGERYAASNFIQRDWFGGGSVMVRGGISLEGHTAFLVLARGTLTGVSYRGEILRPIVRP